MGTGAWHATQPKCSPLTSRQQAGGSLLASHATTNMARRRAQRTSSAHPPPGAGTARQGRQSLPVSSRQPRTWWGRAASWSWAEQPTPHSMHAQQACAAGRGGRRLPRRCAALLVSLCAELPAPLPWRPLRSRMLALVAPARQQAALAMAMSSSQLSLAWRCPRGQGASARARAAPPGAGHGCGLSRCSQPPHRQASACVNGRCRGAWTGFAVPPAAAAVTE